MLRLLALLVPLLSTTAFGQSMAQQFGEGIPADGWPGDPGNPVRRLDDLIAPNSWLVWERSGPPPYTPPGGVPATATRIAVRESFYGDRWDPNRPGCRVEEIYYDFLIHFEDGSKFFYQIMIQRVWCNGQVIGLTRSILTTANDPAGNADTVRSSLVQVANGQTTTTRNRTVNIKPNGQGAIAHSLASVHPTERVEVVAGTNATIDLRGHSTTLCTTNTAATLKAATILLDPGVTLPQLFSPPPQVLPAEDRVDLRPALCSYPGLPAPGPDLAEVAVINVGNVATAASVAWSDTLGWTLGGPALVTLEPAVPETIPVALAYPPSGAPTDSTTLTVTATPLGTTGGAAQLLHDIYFDSDLDGDGVKNCQDPCPMTFNSPSLPDSDLDFLPDECDPCPGGYNFFPEDPCPCYANCDGSTTAPILNVGDFTCFLQRYAAAHAYANCDGSTAPPALNVGDFTCFLMSYAAGCP